jgi:hypothetical protein
MNKVFGIVLSLFLMVSPAMAQVNGYGPFGGAGMGGLMPFAGMGGYMPYVGMMNGFEGQFMSNMYSNAFYGPGYGAGNYGPGPGGSWGGGSVYTPSAPFTW